MSVQSYVFTISRSTEFSLHCDTALRSVTINVHVSADILSHCGDVALVNVLGLERIENVQCI